MTRLDDLDEYAALWRASQPEPEVDWDAVTQPTPALRARWVPLAAAAAVGILVAGIALAGSTLVRSSGAPAHPVTPPTSSPLAYDVPWVDRPVPPNGGLSPLPASPPPADAPACRADQLTTEHAGSQITQDDGISIAFKNTSHSTCLLAGAPNVTATGPGLSPYRVPTNGPKAPADAPSWNMSPGETTSLWVANPRACTENQGGTPTAGPRYD